MSDWNKWNGEVWLSKRKVSDALEQDHKLNVRVMSGVKQKEGIRWTRTRPQAECQGEMDLGMIKVFIY